MNVISPSIDHKAWLRERQNGIGASEVASVLGLPEAYETPLQVYARKVAFELPDDQPTEAMEWGNKLEPLIAQTYQERTGIPIVKTQVFRRDGFLFATLDGVDDVGQIVEFKTISERRASQVLGEQGTNEIPLPWILQAHQQMHCADRRERVTFGVLVGGNQYRTYEVHWNERLWDNVFPRLKCFWDDHVLARVVPSIMTPDDVGALANIYGEAHGVTYLAAEIASCATQWDDLGKQIADLQRARDLAKAKVLEALQNNAIGVLPDGRKLKRSVCITKEHTVKGSQYIRLTLSKA